MIAYRATRACSSTGAPESTAAAVTSPSSLPSMTCLGTGENVLCHYQSLLLPTLFRCRRYDVPWSMGARKFGSCETWPSRESSCLIMADSPALAPGAVLESDLGAGSPEGEWLVEGALACLDWSGMPWLRDDRRGRSSRLALWGRREGIM